MNGYSLGPDTRTPRPAFETLIDVVGLGAGDHAAVIIEALNAVGGYNIVGLLDPDISEFRIGNLTLPILGDDRLLVELPNRNIRYFFNGLGSVKSTTSRSEVFEKACACGLQPISIVHPTARISPSAQLGRGVIVLVGAYIGPRAKLNDNVLINTGAIVEHDCELGDHVHVAPGAILGGRVKVGPGVHVGMGSRVIQGCSIGERAIVGAGAVVVQEVKPHEIVVGVPARPIG